MKLDLLAFCLLCSYFEPLYGVHYCSSSSLCTERCSELLHPQQNEEFPKETFNFQCPLPNRTQSFHMKLFKGENKQEICSIYVDNTTVVMNMSDFCYPVHSAHEVSFTFRNLKTKHSDMYTCCLQTFHPVYRCCKANKSYLYVQVQDSETCLLSESMSWILIGLSAFSTVACILCIAVCFLKHVICQPASHSCHDYSNEYMSMAAVKFR